MEQCCDQDCVCGQEKDGKSIGLHGQLTYADKKKEASFWKSKKKDDKSRESG